MSRARLWTFALGLAIGLGLVVSIGGGGAASADDDFEGDIQPYDHIYMKGSPTPVKGTVLERSRGKYKIRKSNGVIFEVPEGDVLRVEERLTAEDVFRKRAAKLGAGDVESRLALARWGLGYEDLDGNVEEVAKEILAIEPGRREAYHILIDVFDKRIEGVAEIHHETLLDEQLGVVYAAIDRGVQSPKLSIAAGRAFLRVELPELAATSLARAVELLAEPVGAGDVAPLAEYGIDDIAVATAMLRDARVLLGESLMRTGKPAEAETVFGAAVDAALDPDFEALFGRGRARAATGDLAGAATDLDEAVAVDPQSAHAILAQGTVHYLRGDGAQAEASLEGALSLGLEDERDARFHLGLAYVRLGRYRSAATEFVRLLEADPLDPLGRAGIALVHAGRGEKDEALEELDRATRNARGELGGDVLYLQAVVLLELGRADEARDKLAAALRAGFDFDAAARVAVRVHEARDDLAAVSRYAAYLTARSAPTSDDWYTFGRALLATGRREEARHALDEALAIDPNHAPALAARGYAAYIEGDRDAADADFQRSLSADPSLGYARRGLDYLVKARTRRVWSDAFEREDGPEIRNRWSEVERFGADIEVAGGRVVFKGAQSNDPKGKTMLTRSINGARVVEFSAELEVLEGAEHSRFGLRLETVRDGVVVVYRQPDGKLVLAYRYGSTWTGPEEAGVWPDDGKPHRLAIEVGDAGKVEILLDEQVRASCELATLARAQAYDLVIFGRGEAIGNAWRAAADEVNVYIKRDAGGASRPGPRTPTPGPKEPRNPDADDF